MYLTIYIFCNFKFNIGDTSQLHFIRKAQVLEKFDMSVTGLPLTDPLGDEIIRIAVCCIVLYCVVVRLQSFKTVL